MQNSNNNVKDVKNDLFGDKQEVLVLSSIIEQDDTTREISKHFDYQYTGETRVEVVVPKFPTEFQIGLIVGSSGSGKSTLLRNCFGEEEDVEWDNNKCIASNFDSFEEASNRFGAVGLNSIPTWLKPFRVLSNGEQFRANMARRLKNNAVIDEFTSVVNREVAISCSTSIAKYIRRQGLKNIVFCSCHYDIIPYLNPDWVYDVDKKEFYSSGKGCLRREPITIEFYPCERELWDLFKRHHYLSGEINKSAQCFVGMYNNQPIAFASFISLCGRDVKNAWREHRMVVLPDFQGLGIGNKMSEMFGQAFIEKGCQYFAKTSNPRMGVHRDNSTLWRPTVTNHKNRLDYLDKDGNVRGGVMLNHKLAQFHASRTCYSHEFVGDGTKYEYTYKTKSSSKVDLPIDDGVFKVSLF